MARFNQVKEGMAAEEVEVIMGWQKGLASNQPSVVRIYTDGKGFTLVIHFYDGHVADKEISHWDGYAWLTHLQRRLPW